MAELPNRAPVETSTSSNLPAILMMVFAMIAFAIDDAFIKLAADGASAGQVLAIWGLVSTAVFWLAMRRNGERVTREMLQDRNIWYRSVGEIIAASCFVTALTLMPLSNASAILQFQPLVVTLGAAFFLREEVGWRRWSAIFVGFVGVLIIIRPGAEGFNQASILALIAVFGLAVRDIATRAVNKAFSTAAISFIVSAAVLPTGLFLHIAFGPAGWSITTDALVNILVGALFGIVGYYAITTAVRIGEISAIAPFRYSRLLAALILGWAVFGEVPDAPMIIGSVLVIGAGIFTILRESRLRRNQS